MKAHLILIVFLVTGIGLAQPDDGRVSPRVITMPVEDSAVTLLHLGPGYTTTVKLPEEISSIVVGDPASFKAEHSQAEPRLVFLKPITSQPSESNALITTKSGQEVALQLVSAGKGTGKAQVDFFVEYRPFESVLVGSSNPRSFLIAETLPTQQASTSSPPVLGEKPDLVTQELEGEKNLSSPSWQGEEVRAAVGASVKHDHQTLLAFSILNSSKRTIELLPPQIELTGTGHGSGGKRIKAEPVPVSEYRLTSRRLAPGERADGVVVFERPAFKESSERLQLQLAQADQVDRPILLPVPFTAATQGGTQ